MQDYLSKNEINFELLEGEYFDCGDKLGYLKAIIKFGIEDKLIKRDLKSFLKKQLWEKMKISVVSGGFDPLHSGHISYLKSAKKYGDYLIVLLNSDIWLSKKR